jgi:23S rRNA pseudouridine1911/1915/1917 synthase
MAIILPIEKLKTDLSIVSSAILDESDSDETFEAAGDAERHTALTVPVQMHGKRLDVALAALLTDISRSYLQQLLGSGAVKLNGSECTKASSRVKAGDELAIDITPPIQSVPFAAERLDIDVVFEDEHLLVVNKPAGLVVHPAPGNWTGTLLNGLLWRYPDALCLPRAGIVHRLDKNTSGLMVVAKQRIVMDRLTELISTRQVDREYFAIGHGQWKGPKLKEVKLAIGRDPRNRLRMAVVDLEKTPGKTASTRVLLLSDVAEYCLVRCKLDTGRTHQIRVHMAALGHPLVADVLYGGRLETGLFRQALHAFRLSFDHPMTGRALVFECPLPEDLQQSIENTALRYNWDAQIQRSFSSILLD